MHNRKLISSNINEKKNVKTIFFNKYKKKRAKRGLTPSKIGKTNSFSD